MLAPTFHVTCLSLRIVTPQRQGCLPGLYLSVLLSGEAIGPSKTSVLCVYRLRERPQPDGEQSSPL